MAFLLGGWIDRKFNYTHDMSGLEKISGPVILLPNHACGWDPLLVGAASRKRPFYYVTSEHLVRVPFAGKIITALFPPIIRRKGSTDLEVVRNCLAHLKAGHSICIFGEGDQSWDGITGDILPGTPKLVKKSRATLVTYRLEGSFLSLPRWASGARRGRIDGRIAGIYTPDEIEKMSNEELLHAIRRDLYFNIWEWQKNMPDGPVKFIGRRGNRDHAKGLEMLFFMCPGCGKIGTIRTRDDEIFCGCGFRARFLNTGFLETVSPAAEDLPHSFTELPEWDRWQREELEKKVKRIVESESDEVLFRDGPIKLSRIERDHREVALCEGSLSLTIRKGKAVMTAGDRSFAFNEISNMGLVLSMLILFSYGNDYYQISANGINIRKYLLVWKMLNS